MKFGWSSDLRGGARDRFLFSPKKEEAKLEGFQGPPCKVFFKKEDQLYEAIQSVSYDYQQTVNTVHVERKLITSAAQSTFSVDVLKWFCKQR